MNYRIFKRTLPKAWCKETAYRKDAPNWTADNPALGQCAITALLFQKFFGGTIYSGVSDEGIWHYWNKKCGIKFDFTKQQFGKKLQFHDIRKWNREELMSTGDVVMRYNLLYNRFINAIPNK